MLLCQSLVTSAHLFSFASCMFSSQENPPCFGVGSNWEPSFWPTQCFTKSQRNFSHHLHSTLWKLPFCVKPCSLITKRIIGVVDNTTITKILKNKFKWKSKSHWQILHIIFVLLEMYSLGYEMSCCWCTLNLGGTGMMKALQSMKFLECWTARVHRQHDGVEIEKNSFERNIAIETATKRNRTYINNKIRWNLRHADHCRKIDNTTST